MPEGKSIMTADEIYDFVLALMFSDQNEKNDMLSQFLATLNLHLMELLDRENGMREQPLERALIIRSLSDEVDYHRRILAFLPYGIAGTMLAEDDPNIAAQYKNKYEEEKIKCVTCSFKEAPDSYAI